MPVLPSSDALRTVVVTVPTKSVGIAIILTLLFGPLGLFYASVLGGIVVLIGLPLVAALLSVVVVSATGGNILGMLGIFAVVPLMWITSLVWSIVAVNSHNRKLMKGEV